MLYETLWGREKKITQKKKSERNEICRRRRGDSGQREDVWPFLLRQSIYKLTTQCAFKSYKVNKKNHHCVREQVSPGRKSDATPVDQGEWMEYEEGPEGEWTRRKKNIFIITHTVLVIVAQSPTVVLLKDTAAAALSSGHSHTSAAFDIPPSLKHTWANCHHLWPHPKLTKVCWYWSVWFSPLSFTIAAVCSH